MMNPMQGNPMFQMMQMMRGGANPQAVFEQFAQQNPMVQNFLPLIQGKTPQQMQTTYRNMCKERGIDPEAFAKQVKQQFGMN